ncbi:hypothetical protein C5167_014211 [Papaver somniferum]|uniref:Uncharacterized protein n=1 Tax=Papaver somniferum TaxID=3469 RepID=A0A4Y7J5N5_PAPSO|nr:hypothetical protein C5167_014211 [Papaver somniferum]
MVQISEIGSKDMDMDVCMLLSAKEWDEKHVSTCINPHDKQHDIGYPPRTLGYPSTSNVRHFNI